MIGMKKIARRASCCLAIVALGIIVVNAMSCQVIAQTNSVPFVSSPLVPAAVMPGSPGFILTVNGAGFTTASAVKYNGGSLATHFVSGIKVTASVSASQIISAQTAAITVV